MKPQVITVAVLCATALFAVAESGDKPKSDHDLIQGTWKVVSTEESGKMPKVPADFRVVITADMLSMNPGKDADFSIPSRKYTLDASKRPKAMDTSHELDPGKPIVQLAIYALDGDELKLCLGRAGEPRPTKFESKAGDTVVVWVLRRVQQDK